jgi:predicted GNAT superfamily acetyltransferase
MVSIAGRYESLQDTITIEPVINEDGFRRCQDILIKVWDLANGGHRNIIPTRLFRLSQSYGGILLGASNKEGAIIGFAWAFPALDPDGGLFLFSDTLAVLPEYRDRRVGTRLKFAQREWALSHNISLIRWTYDPPESRNAYLNIARLGAIACAYRRNAYGVGATGPNKGIETDRLVTDWRLNSPRVLKLADIYRKPFPPPDLPACLEITYRDGEIIPSRVMLDLQEPRLLMPIPDDYQRLKNKSLSLAQNWRLAVREVCETYFQRGYALVDFHKDEQDRQGCYQLALNESVAASHL